jgi:nucleotide-binding universal stress UspA family protein
MTTDGRPILVAVRDAEEAAPALRLAVEEARRLGCGIDLVHVVHPYPTTAEELAVGGGFVGPSRELLASLTADLHEQLEHRFPVSCDVVVGLVVPTLVTAADGARMVVLGQRDHTDRHWTGFVRTGVSSRASVPVVSVPAEWPLQRDRDLVAAGISDPTNPGPTLSEALRIGRQRGGRVRLVHALWSAEPVDEAGLTRDRVEEWSHQAERQIGEALEAVGDDALGVDIEIRVTHGKPADVLVRTSETAALLLVGRRERSHALGAHLDHVVRSVLKHARCPVMVVPRGPDRADDDGSPTPASLTIP